ncbi:hypothetical protein GCM10017764_02850 [Sphingobacterium griseoflavum]|uniref:Bacteriocin fulvocin C-related protein n=2 Tax=Sphingobacterium griseoflavum TaxID=1474952 RepID=A0ABQ3HT23_9SPHI|nr:hypothetical protein GCM10017764_02850 [Sphingobacterium griseoflavum]
MKKLSILAVSLFMLFSSCQKDEVYTKLSEKDNLALKSIKSASLLKSPDARRIAFSKQFTIDEKCEFIRKRLNSFITDLKLEEVQVNVLNDLTIFLDPEVYVESSTLNLDAKKFEPIWRERALTVFSEDQLNYLFSFKSFDEFKDQASARNLKNVARAGGEASQDCDCSTKSDYCSKGNCKVKICVLDTYSCGFLFLHHCDGLCGN